jgi:hypothetical protein
MAVQIDIGTLRVRPKDHFPLRVAQRWGEGRGEVLFNRVNVDGNCYSNDRADLRFGTRQRRDRLRWWRRLANG